MNTPDPIFVEAKEAARLLGLSLHTIYQRLDKRLIESRYDGGKRLVVYSSLKAYAESLPVVRPGSIEQPGDFDT